MPALARPSPTSEASGALTGQLRQGRLTASSISAPSAIRSVAVPCGPSAGNNDLASDAPTWKAAVATSTAATGSRTARAFARVSLMAKGALRLEGL